MNEGHIYVHNFLALCRDIHRRQQLQRDLRRLVIEYKQASDAGDAKRARTLLREAERVRAQLER